MAQASNLSMEEKDIFKMHEDGFFSDFPVLKVDRLEFVEAILNLCSYKHPENTVLPKG